MTTASEIAFQVAIDRYSADPGHWREHGRANGWRLPLISRWQRLPGMRHWYGLGRLWAMVWRAEHVWHGRVPPAFEREIWEAWGITRGMWHD